MNNELRGKLLDKNIGIGRVWDKAIVDKIQTVPFKPHPWELFQPIDRFQEFRHLMPLLRIYKTLWLTTRCLQVQRRAPAKS